MRKLLVLIMLCMLHLGVQAQTKWNDYARENGQVSYQGQLLPDADAATFEELGFGYGRDRYNVYYRGEVLEFVDPTSFRVDARFTRHHNIGIKSQPVQKEKKQERVEAFLGLDASEQGHYILSGETVVWDGKTVEGADAKSFRDLSAGYGCDRHHAYYKGQLIRNALGGKRFSYLGDDYASDGLHTYFKGKEVERE